MFEFDGHTSFAIRMSLRYYFDLDNFTWLSPRMAHNLYEKDFKKLKKKITEIQNFSQTDKIVL